MIVSKRKPLKELENLIRNYESFFLVGCAECATLCGSGDDEALLSIKEWITKSGKTVTGWFTPKVGCQILGTKRQINQYKESLNQAQCILVLSCGAGAQTITELFEDKPVIPVNDTLFIGNMRRFREFEERCRACGECLLGITNICVITLCPKSMLNGPCGGYKNGKCEVNPELRCVWIVAYEILEKRKLLEKFYENLHGPKDWSKSNSPRALRIEGKD
ncbi:MAG: methylenetetrahydrofolate reductase C-terminal domain-containing protein [Thermodesulfovibrio sp.]|nr:methylenetetrahydrofolate reductase C-terminal domain-containing protein [Thermodesulfovibrio sp.]MDW7972946.1 methylenetetrahydrofolate reductase C-terminal domain-containing protein [Thermodesulfovibrio sp.]